jgi:hypothetical protein
VALARADAAIRQAGATGQAAADAAMAAASALPAPGPATLSARQAPPSPAARTTSGADRANGEPRPSPALGGGSAAATEQAREAELTDLARTLRAIPGVERFGRLRLAELDRAGPSTLKTLWRESRSELEASYGQLTIAEILERFTGPGQPGQAAGA